MSSQETKKQPSVDSSTSMSTSPEDFARRAIELGALGAKRTSSVRSSAAAVSDGRLVNYAGAPAAMHRVAGDWN